MALTSRVLCRRGVPRGAHSSAFAVTDLLDALRGPNPDYVYVELDSAGRIAAAAGGGEAGGGAAKLCVRARLAPALTDSNAVLALCATPPPPSAAPLAAPALCLQAVSALAPHQELQLWFAENALAALDMPFLTLRNIRGRRDYACHRCGAGFDDPNPLKVHLFLRCAPFEPSRFWREATAKLAAIAPNTPAPPAPPALPPAELEALATEWGRSRDGHVCLYCGKLYSRRYGLKIHIRTHTGYRPLRCRYCLRAFGDPSNLNKHVRLHAARQGGAGRGGGAAHECAVCGRAMARRRDLERHLRAHAAPGPASPLLPRLTLATPASPASPGPE